VGDAAHPYNVFDFTLTRSRDGPQQFRREYQQVLLADAYGGYNGVVAGNAITRAGCWAHARRKFIEAEKTAPEMARQAVALLRALFAVEKLAKEVSVADRGALRQAQSVPLLAELRQKLLRWKEQLLPKHPMAEVVNYTLGQWTELNVFCSDGAVPIDNNVSYAACGITNGMPTSGLCRHLNRGSGSTDVRTTCNRHNQRPSRKARRRSGGRYRPGTAPEELEWASARSLSCMSACK
jgi:transposase